MVTPIDQHTTRRKSSRLRPRRPRCSKFGIYFGSTVLARTAGRVCWQALHAPADDIRLLASHQRRVGACWVCCPAGAIDSVLSDQSARHGGRGLPPLLERRTSVNYRLAETPPTGYALFDPGNTGTPPGTSTSTILTLEVTRGWSPPICTTLVPAIRSLAGIVTA